MFVNYTFNLLLYFIQNHYCNLQSNVDMRLKLAENIVLFGGTVMAKGFVARLKEELLENLKSAKYNNLKINSFKFHVAPACENYVGWLGGK